MARSANHDIQNASSDGNDLFWSLSHRRRLDFVDVQSRIREEVPDDSRYHPHNQTAVGTEQEESACCGGGVDGAYHRCCSTNNVCKGTSTSRAWNRQMESLRSKLIDLHDPVRTASTILHAVSTRLPWTRSCIGLCLCLSLHERAVFHEEGVEIRAWTSRGTSSSSQSDEELIDAISPTYARKLLGITVGSPFLPDTI